MVFLVSFFLAYNSRIRGRVIVWRDDQAITWVIERQDILLKMASRSSRDVAEQKPIFSIVVPHIDRELQLS